MNVEKLERSARSLVEATLRVAHRGLPPERAAWIDAFLAEAASIENGGAYLRWIGEGALFVVRTAFPAFAKPLALALLSGAIGLGIAYVDTRPTWDDTGISVMLLLISSFTLGALSPKRPLLWALLVGAWIPVLNIGFQHNAGSLIALVVALIGAYGGAIGRRLLVRDQGRA